MKFQHCSICDQRTGRCEEDQHTDPKTGEPICDDCHDAIVRATLANDKGHPNDE